MLGCNQWALGRNACPCGVLAAQQAEGREKLIPGGFSATSMDLSGDPQGYSQGLPLHPPF